MALLKCPECGHEISEYAEACPNCGCPMSKIQELLANGTQPPQEQPSESGYSYVDVTSDTINAQNSSSQVNIPKCPTCGSTNIKKISTSAKVLNAALFGVYGNKRRKQYHCNDCGYEW